MRVGHHIAVGIEDETRADAALLRLRLAVGLRRGAARVLRLAGNRHAEAAEKLEQVLVDLRIRPAARRTRALGGADIHDRRADSFDELGEVWQCLRSNRHRRHAQQSGEAQRQRAAPNLATDRRMR